MKQKKKEKIILTPACGEGDFLRTFAAHSFFAQFTEKEVAHIIRMGCFLPCAPGEALVHERELTRDFYVLLSGRMVVTRTLYAGDERELGYIESGEFFGEMAFLDGLPRSASVTCIAEGSVFRLSKESFDSLIVRRPGIAYKIVGIIAVALTQRLRNSNDVVESFFSNPNKAILELKTRLLKIRTMLHRV
jgi:CRP-like cAMP-binding protein